METFFSFCVAIRPGQSGAAGSGLYLFGLFHGNRQAGALPAVPHAAIREQKSESRTAKSFSSVLSTLFRSRPKNFLAKESLPAEAARDSFFWIPFNASR